MPWLFSVMQRIDRFIVNPGLTLVLVAGIVLASELHSGASSSSSGGSPPWS